MINAKSSLLMVLLQGILYRRLQIQRYLDEIDFYKNHKFEESSSKILDCIKRLNLLGISNIDLTNCVLSNMTFRNNMGVPLNLKNASLAGTNLENSVFTGVNLEKANFKNANIKQASFANAILTSANMQDADIQRANFEHAQLKNACLKFPTTHFFNSISNP